MKHRCLRGKIRRAINVQTTIEQEAQSGKSSAGHAGAYEFFKDGTFTMIGGKKAPRVSGKWIALDDGRIKADLEVFGATTTIFFVLAGEELEADAGKEKKGRLVRVK